MNLISWPDKPFYIVSRKKKQNSFITVTTTDADPPSTILGLSETPSANSLWLAISGGQVKGLQDDIQPAILVNLGTGKQVSATVTEDGSVEETALSVTELNATSPSAMWILSSVNETWSMIHPKVDTGKCWDYAAGNAIFAWSTNEKEDNQRFEIREDDGTLTINKITYDDNTTDPVGLFGTVSESTGSSVFVDNSTGTADLTETLTFTYEDMTSTTHVMSTTKTSQTSIATKLGLHGVLGSVLTVDADTTITKTNTTETMQSSEEQKSSTTTRTQSVVVTVPAKKKRTYTLKLKNGITGLLNPSTNVWGYVSATIEANFNSSLPGIAPVSVLVPTTYIGSNIVSMILQVTEIDEDGNVSIESISIPPPRSKVNPKFKSNS